MAAVRRSYSSMLSTTTTGLPCFSIVTGSARAVSTSWPNLFLAVFAEMRFTISILKVAIMAIIPLQDLLRLGGEARMNLPGTIGHNWDWRFVWSDTLEKRGRELKNLSQLYGRA